jgi:hypothetical protein
MKLCRSFFFPVIFQTGSQVVDEIHLIHLMHMLRK